MGLPRLNSPPRPAPGASLRSPPSPNQETSPQSGSTYETPGTTPLTMAPHWAPSSHPCCLQPPRGSQGVFSKYQLELAAHLCKNLGQFPISLSKIHNQPGAPAVPSPGPPSHSLGLGQNTRAGLCGGLLPCLGDSRARGLTSGHLPGHGGGEPQHRPQHGLAVGRGRQRPAVRLEQQPLILALKQQQEVVQQQDVDFCRGARPVLSTLAWQPRAAAPRPQPWRSPTALSLVTRHVSGPSWTSLFLVMSRFWRQEGVMVSEGEGGAGEGVDDHGVWRGCPAGNEQGVRVEGPLWLPGCVIRESPGWGGGEERGGQVGRGQGHLELAQHGVAALPQVGQIQAPLIILEPLGQGREGKGVSL